MTSAAQTLVCFAVKEEAAPFKRLTANRPELQTVLTGMGRRNAERAIRLALEQGRPGRVVTAGFAGALAPELAREQIVFEADLETGLQAGLLAAGALAVKFHCAERVASTAQAKGVLRASSGAQAVEMESGFIRELCRARGIPAATIRVILDTAGEDLVLDFNQLMTEDQKIDGRKLALAVLKSPSKIPALLAFQKQSARAANRLTQALAQVLF